MNQQVRPEPANTPPVFEDLGDGVTNDTLTGGGYPYPGLDSSKAKESKNNGSDNVKRRLILSLDGEIIREYRIGANEIHIGRKHGNDIQLNDLALSGRHAVITVQPDYVFIEDLGSTNGTMVNGTHIKKMPLDHGDIIQVGHHQLTYLCEDDARYEPTMFVKAEYDETQFVYTGSGIGPDDSIAKGLPLAGLRVISSVPAPKPVMELRKTYNTLGFQGKCMALITRSADGYTITAVKGFRSRRAMDIPLLNQGPLDTNQHLLSQGDIISIAGFELQFYYLR